MPTPDHLTLYERERLEPPEGNIQLARMLKTAGSLKAAIRELENEREDITGLHLRRLPDNLKAQLLEHYESEIQSRRQELTDIRQSLAEMGYIA